jgi:hypothetical protein
MAAQRVHNPQVEGSSPSPAIMADDLKNSILENAQNPAKVTGDAGSVEQHRLSEQIAADKYLASKTATQSKGLGLKFTKLSPPGAV